MHTYSEPYRPGDALNDSMIRGELIVVPTEQEATLLQSNDFPPLPREVLQSIADNIKRACMAI